MPENGEKLYVIGARNNFKRKVVFLKGFKEEKQAWAKYEELTEKYGFTDEYEVHYALVSSIDDFKKCYPRYKDAPNIW